jgi:hypothetical protein
MRDAPHWHQISSARAASETERLKNAPYFTLESITTNQRFTAIGTLHFRRRCGKEYRFRIRLEYPRHYPKDPPRVFDHDRVFTPTLDGHLFDTHEMCLTLPEREEFTKISEQLTHEVLSAALVWCHKRLIFDRTRKWPGPAEQHGLLAVVDLLIERHVITDVPTMSNWLEQHATTNNAFCAPDVYAPCPCGSGKRLKFCHRDDLQPFFKRLTASNDKRERNHTNG